MHKWQFRRDAHGPFWIIAVADYFVADGSISWDCGYWVGFNWYDNETPKRFAQAHLYGRTYA